MTRLMSEPDFRAVQAAGARSAPHIKPINAFIESIRGQDGRGWAPLTPPHHGGVDAKVLSVLRDPGPATRDGEGSGFISVENDDPTAERQALLFKQNGISSRDVLPWNAYPWYINAAPNAEQSAAGAHVLIDLLELLPDLQVVLLQGRDAERSWKRAVKLSPRLGVTEHLTVLATIHPGRQALFHPDKDERERRITHQEQTFRAVASVLETP